MKIKDLLTQNTLTLSFEVFPPKTEIGFESVKSATEEIAKLRPAFMSVTYGAGGGKNGSKCSSFTSVSVCGRSQCENASRSHDEYYEWR